MTQVKIITHRGLQPTKSDFWFESSYEAFQSQLNDGYDGLEFDPSFLADGEIAITHDKTAKRITAGIDERTFSEITAAEMKAIKFSKGKVAFFDELMDLIRKSNSTVNALHLKGIYQEQKYLDRLLLALEKNSDVLDKIILFDARPEIAKFLKEKNPKLLLAPSVAHPYDIERYNSCVLGTLISIEDAVALKNYYDWVWLDEWDLAGANGSAKKFYTAETFNILKNAGYKIALVTPELHGTSPGLLGGEAHPDATPKEKLFDRIKEIISLQPDAVCTDYPEEVRAMQK